MPNVIEKFRILAGALSSGKYFIIMVIFAFCVFFLGLGARDLWGGDEPRVAGISSEMTFDGKWLAPHLNGKPFLEQPPLYYWSNALSFKIFGYSSSATKLPSALAAFLGVMAVFMLVKAMKYSNLAALLSGVMLATSAQYWRYGRKCMVDMFLCAFIIIAMTAFYKLCSSDKTKNKISWYLLFILALGGAIFSKGLIGLAIPSSALFFWLLVDDIYDKRKFNFSRWIFLFSGALLCFIPVGIWLYFLYRDFGFDAFYTVTWHNNLGRFIGSHPDHKEPFYYYLLKLPEQLQPWTVLLPFAVIFHFIRAKKEKTANSWFMLCWLLIPYLMLSIAAGKRQVYVLPLYAAEAIMIGTMLAMCLEGRVKLPWKINYPLIAKIFAIALTAALGVGGIVFAGIVFYCHETFVALFFPAVMLLAALCSWRFMSKSKIGAVALALLVALAATYIAVDTVLFRINNAKQSYQPLFEWCRAEIDSGKKLYLYAPTERISGGAVFYLGSRMPGLSLSAQTIEANAIVLTEDSNLEKLKDHGYVTLKFFEIKKDKYYLLKHEGGAK